MKRDDTFFFIQEFMFMFDVVSFRNNNNNNNVFKFFSVINFIYAYEYVPIFSIKKT